MFDIMHLRQASPLNGKEVMTMANGALYKPGMDNRPAGKYREVGSRGGAVSRPRSVKIDQGDRLPPTQEKGRRWVRM